MLEELRGLSKFTSQYVAHGVKIKMASEILINGKILKEKFKKNHRESMFNIENMHAIKSGFFLLLDKFFKIL